MTLCGIYLVLLNGFWARIPFLVHTPSHLGPLDVAAGFKAAEKAQMVAAPESLVKEVLSYVDYAALVYCKKITQDMVKGTQFHRRIRDLETLTTAHVFVNKKKEIIVTFRGCDSYAKFKQGHNTTKYALYNIPGPKVHANVQRFTLSIYTRLLKVISNLCMYHPRYRVVLVSHSLGGAIATLMAPYVASYLIINPRNIRIITYNQLVSATGSLPSTTTASTST
ncbi:hypothetical protein DSO57_1002370 [Entomophthora muscae]|uniref:Uncharacterized protein n=1 Tax=Entomophthora muscae TaxID=34485 RepID=A0ACC2RNX0_9FUNG|nr:hypothetical protein DSO57_1002370 [Entomophthora muscae]